MRERLPAAVSALVIIRDDLLAAVGGNVAVPTDGRQINGNGLSLQPEAVPAQRGPEAHRHQALSPLAGLAAT